MLSSKLIETQTGKTLGTADGIYTDLDTMLDDMGNFSSKIVRSVAATATPVLAEEPAPSEKEPVLAGEEPSVAEGPEPTPAPEAVEAPKPKGEPAAVDWKTIGGIGLVSVGIIAAGVGGYFAYDAYSVTEEAWLAYDTSAADQVTIDSLYDTYLAVYDEKQPLFMTGLYIAGGGILTAGVGTLLLLLPKKDASVDVATAVVPAPKSLSLYVSVKY